MYITDPISVLQTCAAKLSLHSRAVLAVRCGSDGSYVWWGQHPSECYHAPAHLIEDVKDPTGTAVKAIKRSLTGCSSATQLVIVR
jgi:sugar/nucleoside kinase (ribokinase family)